MFKQILKDPLLHFLILGSLLFVFFMLVSDDETPVEGEIIVTAGKIDQLTVLFERTRQRPPSQAELQGLVRDWVREEAAYREALRLGLDRNDTVLRRRMRQKLELLAKDMAAVSQPSEEQLHAYLKENADRFNIDARYSIRQIYLRPDRDEKLSDYAENLLTLLSKDASIDARSLGDQTLLEHAYRDVSGRELARLFGDEFASSLGKLDSGQWEGPIKSEYGAHLVIVDAHEPGRIPLLDEVRDQVRREWETDQRMAALNDLYEELVGRYQVIVEWREQGATEAGS